ncbi:MAG: TonB-dependent receptor [Burkholderiaceae bacterium]|nr:TonB-dependent receptor [Burkholderiaceae bacterium]
MLKRSRMSVAVLAALSAGVIAAPGAYAQAQQQLERVEITGSSLRRVDAETALPVTIIKAEDLIKQGVTTAEGAVARIAANQSQLGVSGSIGATTGGQSSADLRGLGGNGNKTLVLLNGRRVANHAFDSGSADLNAIPLSAIDRIEVLRDGASAIYGTDAIGGVINFILRRDFQGIEVSAENQAPQAAGGDVNRATLAAGFGSLTKDRFNVLATLDWRDQKVVEAAARPFAATGIINGDITGGTSGSSFPGDLGGFEPSLPTCAPPSSIPNEAGTACRYDFTRDIDIVPKNDQLTMLLRGAFALPGDHVISAEYLRAENNVTTRVAPAPVSHFIPATSPFIPVGAPPPGQVGTIGVGWVANWRQVPAGKRTSTSETTTERWLLEANGAFAGFDYRAAFGNSKNKATEGTADGYTNNSVIAAGVANGIINPFGPQTAAGSALINSAKLNGATTVGEGDVDFFDFRLNRDLFQMQNGTVSGAFGMEFRKEKYGFEATDLTAQLPSLGVDPDSDTSGERDVKAAYFEFNLPILKNLEMTFAGRFDDYSDFGNTFNPKIGVRYQPMREILLRGSWNTGFRAPTMYDIYQPASLTFTSDPYDDPLLCPGGTAVPGASAGVVCGQQVLQRQGGPVGAGRPAATLQPEESETYSLGVVFEPVTGVTLGIDYWNIKIENQISGLAEQAIFGNSGKYASRFVRCSQISAAQRATIDSCLNFPAFDPIAFIDTPTENLGELRTSGVDVSFAWRIGTTPYGAWSVGIDGTYIDKYEYQREIGGEFVQNAGVYADASPVFRWQHVAQVNWSAGNWAANLTNLYRSGYVDQDPQFSVRNYQLWDTSVTWTGVKNLGLTFGIKNLLDEDPPVSVQGTTFQRGYDPRYTNPLGRTYTVRAAYKFF